MYYVYVLTSSRNNTIYVGVTNDLMRRVAEHKNEVIDGFTKKYHIHKLVYFEQTTDVYSALTREKQIKSWSRNKKNDLINRLNPEWKDLSIDFEP